MISFNPLTELFEIGGFSVQAWGTIVALGALLAIILILREAKKRKTTENAETLLLFIALFSIIGARIAYILVNPGEFSSILDYFKVWEGGLISWGVILGGIIGILIFRLTSKIKSQELLSLLDMMMPYLMLAFAIGSIGCFVRGCCFGIPTDLPWGINYGENSLSGAISVHPTQIYHAIADFIIFLILLKLGKKRYKLEKKGIKSRYDFFNRSGNIFLLFIALYSAERFLIDFLRYHPANEYLSIFTITQIICAVLFAAGLFLIKNKKRSRKTKH